MGYLILFAVLIAPLVWWLWSETAKTLKDDYKNEF